MKIPQAPTWLAGEVSLPLAYAEESAPRSTRPEQQPISFGGISVILGAWDHDISGCNEAPTVHQFEALHRLL